MKLDTFFLKLTVNFRHLVGWSMFIIVIILRCLVVGNPVSFFSIVMLLLMTFLIYHIGVLGMRLLARLRVYERLVSRIERRVVAFLSQNNSNPLRDYIWVNLFFYIVIRALYCWLTDSTLRLTAFNMISSYILITVISGSSNPIAVTAAVAFPFLFLLFDYRSSAVAGFFQKNPYLVTKMLNSPLLGGRGFG